MTDTFPMMFLGGRLDHAIRRVARSVIEPGRPAAVRYRLPESATEPEEFYEARKINIPGKHTWWLYVLEGYDPPRSHILDTNPYPV